MIALVFALAACDEDGGPTAPEGPIDLESSPLLSGGEGLLHSPRFSNLDLQSAVDAEGEVVPNRWTNFSVAVDGAEVDSWRVAEDQVGFRVPIDRSGTATVEVIGGDVAHTSFSVRRLGLVSGVRYDTRCGWLISTHLGPFGFVSLGEDGIVVNALCYDPVLAQGLSGYARLLPPLSGSLEPIPDGSVAYDINEEPPATVRMYTPGTTFAADQVILERPVPVGSSAPELWRARNGVEVEYVEPASCIAHPSEAFAVLELADALCLTIDATGTVRRNDEPIYQLSLDAPFGWPAVRFELSAHGHSMLAGFGYAGQLDEAAELPVFEPDGRLAYTIGDFAVSQLAAAIFSPTGDEIYLVGRAPAESLQPFESFIERRDAATGELLSRRAFEDDDATGAEGLVGATFVGDRLWVAHSASLAFHSDPDLPRPMHAAALHVVDPETLATERTIYFQTPSVQGYRAGQVRPLLGSAVIPDVTGRRAYVVTEYDDHMFGYLIEVH